jgi:prevent-host-death family protein
MSQFNVADAKARFSSLIRKAMAGEEVVISRDNKPIIKLQPVRRSSRRRKPGSAKGQVWVSRDFGAALKDFAEYR